MGLVISLIVLLAMAAACQEPLKLPEVPKSVSDKLITIYDKFDDQYTIAAYQTSKTGDETIQMILIILYSQQGKKLYMGTTYVGSTWKWLEYSVIFVNDTRYETPHLEAMTETGCEMIEGGVRELIPLVYSDKDVAKIVNAIAAADVDSIIEYRWYGDSGNIDGKFTKAEIEAWKVVFEYYNAIDAKIWF